MRAILIRWMEGGFANWKSEYQPAVIGVDRGQLKYVAEKCPVSFGIFSVNNYVGAGNHLPCKRYFAAPVAAVL